MATSLALAATMLLLPTTQAQAHTSGPPSGQPYAIGSSDGYVYSAFEINGDDMWVYDVTSYDRASAYVYWETSYGRVGSCRNSHGAGTWHECVEDLAENTTIKWWHFSYDGNTGALTYRSGPYTSRTS